MRCTSILAAASLLLRFVLVQAAPLGEEFFREVDVRLEAPPEAQRYYAARVEAALAHAGLAPSKPQYFLVVDRSPAAP